jgi:hypothetical protein
MTTLHDSRLSDGRRIITYSIVDLPNPPGPPIGFETKIYWLDDRPPDVLDRYTDPEVATDGHWNWCYSMSFGNPLPDNFPADRKDNGYP